MVTPVKAMTMDAIIRGLTFLLKKSTPRIMVKQGMVEMMMEDSDVEVYLIPDVSNKE